MATYKYTTKELIDCVYYESSLELLAALKLIVTNGIEANGSLQGLHDNMLPALTGEQLNLGPLNRMMISDLYDKVHWRVTAEPEEEKIGFIKGQAIEFKENVINEVYCDNEVDINCPDYLNYHEFNQEELIKCIYYICVVDHLKETIRKVEQYMSEDKTLEDFNGLLPQCTEEYIKLNKMNREMIVSLNRQMWQWFGSISGEEFADFIKAQAADFDICIDVRPVGEYQDGEVVFYDDEKV